MICAMGRKRDNSSALLLEKYNQICEENGIEPSLNEFELLTLLAEVIVEITLKEEL